jgi:hypothetical protein
MADDLEARIRAFQQCIDQRDEALAEDILDPDYALLLVMPARAVVARKQWLAVLPEYVVHSYEIHEQIIDVDNDCAAVLHRATMKATVQGQDRSGTFIISDIWRLRDGSWRVWRRHSTPLAAGELRIEE